MQEKTCVWPGKEIRFSLVSLVGLLKRHGNCMSTLQVDTHLYGTPVWRTCIYSYTYSTSTSSYQFWLLTKTASDQRLELEKAWEQGYTMLALFPSPIQSLWTRLRYSIHQASCFLQVKGRQGQTIAPPILHPWKHVELSGLCTLQT